MEKGVLAVIAAGGATGALARYGLSSLWPSPWTTFAINVSGCLLMGALMVLVTEVWTGSRLLRPFLGTGVLGGFTTFSAYAVDFHGLIDRPAIAVAYLLGTLICALVAVYAGSVLMRSIRLVRRADED